jgi:hypothetical protein
MQSYSRRITGAEFSTPAGPCTYTPNRKEDERKRKSGLREARDSLIQRSLARTEYGTRSFRARQNKPWRPARDVHKRTGLVQKWTAMEEGVSAAQLRNQDYWPIPTLTWNRPDEQNHVRKLNLDLRVQFSASTQSPLLISRLLGAGNAHWPEVASRAQEAFTWLEHCRFRLL